MRILLRGTLLLLIAHSAPCPGFARPAAAAEAAVWQPVRALADGAAALAFDAHGGRLAVADARGLYVGVPGGTFLRAGLQGPLHDVMFLSGQGGGLLAAGEAGLFRVAPDGRARRVAPAPGAGARDVRRLAAAAGAVALATADGVYVSADGEAWQRASLRWPSAEATSVALREAGGALECWAVLGGRIWTATLQREGTRLREISARPLVLPDAPASAAVDLLFGAGEADVVVVTADALVVRNGDGAAWRTLRPALAPGAQLARLVWARGRFWLATDRGLWFASALAGSWRRAAPPFDSQPVRAIAGAPARLFAANDSGVRELVEAAAPPRAGAAGALRPRAHEPSIASVQRAAIAHVELGPARMRALRRGVDRRGWLPILALRVGAGFDRDRDVDYDEAFLSGDTRRLIDRGHGESRDFDAALTLSWDLGEVAYHPEAIDVSRESREVLKLRDDVLDEVNQLYFERRRVLAELELGAGALSAAEALRLELRAAELAAGLDAWTGGWFRRAAAGPQP